MKYENTLKFLESRRWGKLARQIEKTIGPRKGNHPQVEADLTVTGTGAQIQYIQAGLLVWIFEDRPVAATAEGWGANRAAILADFRGKSEDQLARWLDETQTWVASWAPPEPTPVVQQPVVQPPVRTVAQASPARQAVPVQRTGAVAQLASNLGSQIPVQGLIPHRAPANANLSRTPATEVTTVARQPVTTTPTVQNPAPAVPARPRRLSKGPGEVASLKISDLVTRLEGMADLKALMVADIPLGKHGKYLTEKDTNQLAELPKGFLRDTSKAQGWLDLGKAVLTNKVGKCWSCAAAAIYKMVSDAAFDGVRIESLGATNYDHHFVAINRDPRTDLTKMSTWNGDAVIVDLWQANLTEWWNRAPGAETKSQVCWSPSTYTYKEATVKSFCVFEPKHRTGDRANVASTGKALHAATIATGLGKLKDCYLNHFGKNVKGKNCGCSGWCDVKAVAK